ncbi:sulfite exporter TauE/SafE family protein [Rhodobacter sp. KR11]|uniref:sulfite exporter TauE/SafE family protein n=1 Tax=Rhodobacter sp. KR11 TaxID=2974588 RepID=UPI002222C03E|nr:sulfite exporter TauE/SafE family protein [Rhodobacter sp. KR11]MCW1917570.1 sulfite exporter TauE/SafE family protein [Rhodobacter sp. KR11]
MFDLSPLGLAWMALAILVAGFVRGYSGFGFSAMTIAASSLVMNPLDFVAVVVVWEAVMTLQAWKGAGADVDWRRVGLLTLGAVLGLPVGLWVLGMISEEAAKALISGYVLVMCLVLLAGWRMKAQAGRVATLTAGIVSGLANAPGMGGLPVAAFFAAQPMAPAVFRATLVAYFPILDLYSAPLYWYHGMVSLETGKAALIGLPLVLLSNWAGSRHFLTTDPQDFRRFAILLLGGLAALGLLKAVL